MTIPIRNKLLQGVLVEHVYAVGGCLRDLHWGVPTKDFDFCVEQKGGAETVVKELASRFGGRVFQTGLGYPIWSWKDPEFPDFDFQFADTQKEMFPDSNSRSRVSSFGTLREDCERRDFTINMMFFHIATESWRDPSGVARLDLNQKLLRVHPQVQPDKILSDDPLRILRFFRFWGRWKLRPSPDLLESIERQCFRIKIVSAERVRDEFKKWIEKGHFRDSLAMTHKLGILQELFGPHGPSGFDKLEGLESFSAALQWAALLDSEEQREAVGTRLQWSRPFLEKITRLSELQNQWLSSQDLPATRHWYRRYFHESPDVQEWLNEWLHANRSIEKFEQVRALGDPILPYSSEDLMKWSGLTPGPKLGALKEQLLEWVETQRILGKSPNPLAAQEWMTKNFLR